MLKTVGEIYFKIQALSYLHLAFKYMIYHLFFFYFFWLRMHRTSMNMTHKLKEEIERGKHVIMDLQERKISASQKEISFSAGSAGRNSFLLANENKL